MDLPKIIQGGMGIAISNWRLAQAVSSQGYLGVVSSTGVGHIMASRLMDGDLEGHLRRALSHFPYPDVTERILESYYVPGGIPAGQPYKRPPMWTVKPPKALNELTVAANFAEVFLAKEGHANPVGINLLEKLQLPTMASLYGAMLAGVDYVIMGAGIPGQVPGILDQLTTHQPVSYRLDVLGTDRNDDFRIYFEPEAIFPDVSAKLGTLKRPYFLPIISSAVLAMSLVKRATGRIDGFVIETPIAGGHNAAPRGALRLNEQGEPIYGERDEIDLDKIKSLGLPFWLAGGYGTPEGLRLALEQGAAGIQVGTMFAYCNESGMEATIKQELIQRTLKGQASIHTSPTASPTGFPFKVAKMEGSLSEQDVYEGRVRFCDMGYLRHLYKTDNERIGYRCPAEPEDLYAKKGGDPADAENRLCLCNGLMSIAGFPQHRPDGYVEPPLITSGDKVRDLEQIVKPGQTSYSALDVLEYLTGARNDG